MAIQTPATTKMVQNIIDGTTVPQKAKKLETARTVRTNLASTNAASFDGTANITPGVSGTLPVANGGTGATSLDGANIVTKNTQQTITGQKKFNDYALVLNDHADFIANDIDINSNPTSEKFAYFNGKDKNGNLLGAIGFYQDPTGNTGAYLQANHGATWGGNLGIKTKAGASDVFAYAPNPPVESNINQIATTYWFDQKVNRKYMIEAWNPITSGQKTANLLGYSLLVFLLTIGEERYPFYMPKSVFAGLNGSANKLVLCINNSDYNRYISLHYVNDNAIYIDNVVSVTRLILYGF